MRPASLGLLPGLLLGRLPGLPRLVLRGLVLGLLVGLAAGCSGPPPLEVQAPRPGSGASRTCGALVRALPSSVSDQEQRPVDAGPGFAAAWGDPPIELRCGVGRPRGLDRFAACQVADGVAWYVPESQQTGRPGPITMTTVGRSVYVEVRLPAAYWPPANAMVDLAPALRRTTRELRPCV